MSIFNKLIQKWTVVIGAICVFSYSSILVASELGWPGTDLRGVPCHGEHMPYGPFDYTNPEHRKLKLPIVEEYHFTKEMESKAGSDIRMNGQFSYTLRAFPNHHRALYAVVRHQLRFDKELYEKGKTPAECYFQRAEAFSPGDVKVYQLYAYYLTKKGQDKMAIREYEKALSIKPQGALYYQLGKSNFKIKQYDDAVKYAKLAIDNGFKKTDLKKKLQAIGKWQ